MPTATIVSVNVGRTREWPWEGRTVRTAFLKRSVEGRVHVGPLGLEGDEVSDHVNHGGPTQAIYVYPSEHYAYWAEALARADLPWGSFGENLTTAGLNEAELSVGDRLDGPDVSFVVQKPRTPCYKLNVRFGRPDVLRRFARAGRPGFYLSVVRPGSVRQGDTLRLQPADGPHASVRDVYVARMRSAEAPSESG